MLKMISEFSPPVAIPYESETTQDIERRMQEDLQKNFTISIIETSNSRVLPRNEVLMNDREYHISFTRLPWE